jgi:hypothetical protein
MPGDVPGRPPAIGQLDGVDPEGQVRPAMDDPRVDDAFDEVGPGVVLRGRSLDR